MRRAGTPDHRRVLPAGVRRGPPRSGDAGEGELINRDRVVARASQALFDRPLVTNTARGLLVEAIIAEALEPDWRWCSADYANWDFERGSTRLEVKQSATLQSWNAETLKASACSFDIAHRQQAWEDGRWTTGRRRAASVYVFAHHPVAHAGADHRQPDQWAFYVVPSATLPDQRRLSLNGVKRLAQAVSLEQLSQKLDEVTPP